MRFVADPNSVELNIDGTTDKCSKGEDINFIFTGFTLSGKVGFKAYHTCNNRLTLSVQCMPSIKLREGVEGLCADTHVEV